MLAKLRTSLLTPNAATSLLLRTSQSSNYQQVMRQSIMMTQYQQCQFGNLQQRINRRLRKYRQEKI
jgi:hypothetical protein